MTVLPDLQGLCFFKTRSSEVSKITFIKNSRHNFRQGRLTSDYLPGTQNHHHPPREITIVFFLPSRSPILVGNTFSPLGCNQITGASCVLCSWMSIVFFFSFFFLIMLKHYNSEDARCNCNCCKVMMPDC